MPPEKQTYAIRSPTADLIARSRRSSAPISAMFHRHAAVFLGDQACDFHTQIVDRPHCLLCNAIQVVKFGFRADSSVRKRRHFNADLMSAELHYSGFAPQ